MNQALVSYVLGTIAKVADVNPRDVHTSLRDGTVTLNNVSLRKDTLNSLLPIPMERGDIPEVVVKLPNPTTANPMRIEVHGAHLTLPLDLEFPPTGRTMEEILADITPTTILGVVLAHTDASATADAGDDAQNTDCAAANAAPPGQHERSSSTSFSGSDEGTHSVDEAFLETALGSDEDEDMLSCHSASDISDSDSVAESAEASEDEAVAGKKSGWLSFLRDRATRSLERLWQRKVEIVFTDVQLTVPSDARQRIGFEVTLKELATTIEPTQNADTEQMKVVRVKVQQARALANTGIATPTVVSVGEVEVTVTRANSKMSGAELRRNTTVEFHGVTQIIADEDTLLALLKCKVTRDIMMTLPPYCRPYASLRRERSLWPYVSRCVIEKVRDLHRRYNFNLSHLRFFAHSRERYIQLLDDCHRTHNVQARRQELAEAEQDLRYPDVILFLRQKLQRRYAVALSTSLASPTSEKMAEEHARRAAAAAESPSLSGVQLLQSTHVEWESVRIALPSASAIVVQRTKLILRNSETVFTIEDVQLVAGQRVHSLRLDRASQLRAAIEGLGGDDTAAPLVCLRQTTSPDESSREETKLELSEVDVQLHVDELHGVLVPLLDVLSQIGLQERVPTAALETSSAAAAADAMRRSRTLICVVPHIALQLDTLQLVVDRLAVSSASVAGPGLAPVPPTYGCTLQSLSVRSEDGTYVLMPVRIEMKDTDHTISMSAVHVAVNADCWSYLRRVRDSVHELVARIPQQLIAHQVTLAAADAEAAVRQVTYHTLEQCGEELPARRDVRRGHLQGCVLEGVSFCFDPLGMRVEVGNIQATRTAPAAGRSVGRPIYGVHVCVQSVEATLTHDDHHSLTVSLRDGLEVHSGAVWCDNPSREPVGAVAAAFAATGTVLSVSAVTCSWMALMGTAAESRVMTPAAVDGAAPAACSPEGDTLAAAGHLRVVLVEGVTQATVDSVNLLDNGVELRSIGVLMRPDFSSTASTERPYRASLLQISCGLKHVSLSAVAAVPYAEIVPPVVNVVSFLVQEIVPAVAYQLFFSGYTDIAANVETVDPKGCSFTWDEDGGAGGCIQLAINPRVQDRTADREHESAESATAKALEAFGPLMPSVTSGALILMTNDTAALRISLKAPRLHCILSSARAHSVTPLFAEATASTDQKYGLPAASTGPPRHSTDTQSSQAVAGAAVLVRAVSVQIPLEKMPFWAADVQALPAVPLKVAVERIKFSLCSSADGPGAMAVDGAVSEDSVTGATRTLVHCAVGPLSLERTRQTTVVSSPPVLALSMPSGVSSPLEPQGGIESGGDLGRSASPILSESGRDSVVGVEEELDSTTVQLQEWSASASFAHELEHYAAARRLLETLQCAATAAQSQRLTVVRHGVQCSSFNLLSTGMLYLDASSTPGQVLVIEDCAFSWPEGSDGLSLVVCADTAVLFRRCVFKRKAPPTGFHGTTAGRLSSAAPCALIRCASSLTSIYVCEECSEIDLSAEPFVVETASSSPPPLPVEHPHHRQQLSVVALGGSLTVHFDDATALQARHARISVSATIKRSKRSLQVRCDGAHASVKRRSRRMGKVVGCTLPVLPKLTLELDVVHKVRKNSIAAKCSIGVGEVHLPLLFDLLDRPRSVVQWLATHPLASATQQNHLTVTGFVPPTLPPLPRVSATTGSSVPEDGSSLPVTAVIPFASWRILCVLSLTRARLCLSNELTVATATLSNTFFWSRKERGVDGEVEARLALHDVAVWEFAQQAPKDVCANPFFVGLQGRLFDGATSSFQLTTSTLDVALSTTQVRLLAAVANHSLASSPGRSTHRDSNSVRVVNQTGIPLTLRAASTKDSSGKAGAPLDAEKGQSSFVHAASGAVCEMTGVTLVAEPEQLIVALGADAVAPTPTGAAVPLAPRLTVDRVALTPKTDATMYGLQDSVAYRAFYVFLSDGSVLHVTDALAKGTLCQEVCVRTTFQIRNETSFSLRFTSQHSQQELSVLPRTLSCMPLGLLACPDLQVALSTAKNGGPEELCEDAEETAADLSLREPLWGTRATSALDAIRGPGNAGIFSVPSSFLSYASSPHTQSEFRREFVLQADGSKAYLDFEFSDSGGHSGAARVLCVHPSRSQLRNDTCLPLEVDILEPPRSTERGGGRNTVAGDDRERAVLTTFVLQPGETRSLHSLNPRSAYPIRIRTECFGERYTLSEPFGGPAQLYPRRTEAEYSCTWQEGGTSEDDDKLSYSLKGLRHTYTDSDEAVSDAAEGKTVELALRHVNKSRYCSLILRAVQQQQQLGGRARVWSLQAAAMALVVNRCEADVTLETASGMTVGTLAAQGLGRCCFTSAAPWRGEDDRNTYGYLPLDAGLHLSAECIGSSDEFAVESGTLTGSLIVCSHPPRAARRHDARSECDTAAVTSFFFLLRQQVGPAPFFDLLPPVVFVNEDPCNSLYVLHEVRSTKGQKFGVASPVTAQNPTLAPPASLPPASPTVLASHRQTSRGSSVTSEDAERVATKVPASGQTGYHLLSKSGYSNCFSFSCDGGQSYSQAVETDLLPGSTWSGLVVCSSGAGAGDYHLHQVRVIKRGLCDPALIVVGPSQSLFTRVVNFSATVFEEGAPLTVCSLEAIGLPPTPNSVPTLGRGDGLALTVLSDDGVEAGSNRTFALNLPVRRQRGNAAMWSSTTRMGEYGVASIRVSLPSAAVEPWTVVAIVGGSRGTPSALPTPALNGEPVFAGQLLAVQQRAGRPAGSTGSLSTPSSPMGASTSALARAGLYAREKGVGESPGERVAVGAPWCLTAVRAEYQASPVSLSLANTAEKIQVRLSVESVALWASVVESACSAQCSVKALSARTTDPQTGEQLVLEPAVMDLAFRDATVTPQLLSAQSAHLSCSRLVVTVSDLLIHQLLRLAEQCAAPPTPLTPQEVLQRCTGPAESLTSAACVGPSRRVSIAKATLPEVPVILSWDRSVCDPEVERVLTFASLIPSLHHASLLIPKLQLTRLSTASFGELASMIEQILIMEVLKQIPKIVSTVGFFPQHTSLLEQLTSRAASFLFGTRSPPTAGERGGGDSASLI